MPRPDPSRPVGFPARYPLLQAPNAPFAVFLLARVAGLIAGGDVGDALRGVAVVALTIWAYEELARGVNGFRRVLGAAVLVYLVVELARGLG